MTYAIITAAGSSNRMGREKQFINIKGKPLIYYTIDAFNRSEYIDEIILVVSEAIKESVELLVRQYSFDKVSKVILGGATRGESVQKGIEQVASDGKILIHDGARPLVSAELIGRVVTALDDYDSVIPVIPLKDTVKKVCYDIVEATIDRDSYVAVQTPQGFSSTVIKKAFSKYDDAINCYDDAMLVEINTDYKTKVVVGDEKNIKATTPIDIKLIEMFME